MSEGIKLRVISLGAGVQSTTMALMAAHGEIGPMPDCAIFADTGAEPAATYAYLEWISRPGFLPFPVHRVQGGNLMEDLQNGFSDVGATGRFVSVPFFIAKVREGHGGIEASMGRRQCTRHYKIDVLRRKQRELLGYKPKSRIPQKSIEVWIGISTDEAIRMKDSRDKWQVNRWPLIEKNMSRQMCVEWISANKYPVPPKSACIFCPYRDNNGWREMKLSSPAEFEKACEIDERIREFGHLRKWRNRLYLHRHLKPLRDVDLSTAAERGQGEFGFLQECDGMCGV